MNLEATARLAAALFGQHPAPDPERGEDWREQALCAQVDPDLWFPEKGSQTHASKKVCAACPVAAQCLEWAVTHKQREGVWGGKSDQERRAIERQRKQAA